jgi:small nuclear ribonucleoprotein (snRNP)-like protein
MGWEEFLHKEVVIDTASSFVYLGRLKEVGQDFVVLQDVDVHDRNEGPSTKERYILETRKYGIKPNRKSVSILRGSIVSLSLLEDVITY